MSYRWSFIYKKTILIALGVFLFAGCDGAKPKVQWETRIAGTYQGMQPGFSETIKLQTDGVFQHQVSLDGKLACSESGTWSYDEKRGAIMVEPFTSFFDSRKQTVIQSGEPFAVWALFWIRDGTATNFISPSTEFTFCLQRQMAEGTVTNK